MNEKDIKEKEKEAEIGRERESGKEWPMENRYWGEV